MGKAVSFPVIFCNGPIEVNIPPVEVNPKLDVKTFEKLISKRTKLHPNETLIYFAPKKAVAQWSDEDIIPIFSNGNVSFRFITQQKNRYCFYVIPKLCMWASMVSHIKYSKKKMAAAALMEFPLSRGSVYLRPTTPAIPSVNRIIPGYYLRGPTPAIPLVNKVRIPRYFDQSADMAAAAMEIQNNIEKPTKIVDSSNKLLFCEECAKTKKNVKEASFHRCVNDQVIQFFRTTAGNIARPTKSSRTETETETETAGWKLF